MDEPTLAVVLWGAAVLLLGWTWLPALISAVGGGRYANGGTDDPVALDPTAGEADYAFWARQLLALGYEPIGQGWMRLTFHGPLWRYETRVRAFYAKAKQAYAFVQKQPRPLDVWWLTIFATCWQDGGLLVTSNANDEAPGDGEFVVQGMESMDLAAVEELHLGHKVRLEAAGRRPERDGRFDTLLKATEAHAGPASRHLGLKTAQTYLLAHGTIHLFLSAPVAYMMGLGHWSVPMVNLILGAVLSLSEHAAKRAAGRLMRVQLARRLDGPPGQS
jgi:hypothetical protein